MDIHDKAVKKTELVISALTYARGHQLDITKKDDVIKILEALHQSVSEENVSEFMKLLEQTKTFMEMTDKKKRAKEPKLPN